MVRAKVAGAAWLRIVFLCLVSVAFVLNSISESGMAQEQVETASDADKANLWTRDGLDWPGFLGSHRNGSSDETGLRFNWSEDSPDVVWSHRVGEGYGIGAVANGRYFHFDRHRDQARLRALNAETGKELWQFTYPTNYTDSYGFDGGPRGSPTVDDDRVYIHGVEGMLYCLNALTGEQLWEVNTTERFGVIQNFFGVGGSPLIFEGMLIVMIGGSPAESKDVPAGRLGEVKPDSSGIVAFDKMTGEVRYKTIDDLASYSSPTIVKLDGEEVGLAFCRTGLHGFQPADGKVLFELPYRALKYESVNAATPVVFDSKILITESYGVGGALLKMNEGQIEKVWADDGRRDAALTCHWNTPVVFDGFAYASCGENKSNARLCCVRLADGKLMWEQPGMSRSSLTLVQGHLICLTEEGRLLALKPDSEKFNVVGEVSADDLNLISPCWAAPIVSHGCIYLRGKSFVRCLKISDK